MKDKWELIFAGVGGQGLITCATVLGEAVTIGEGKNAALSSSYGVETRGTFTKSDLIVSCEPIDFPEALRPDAVIALADVAYRKYVRELSGSAILIYDDSEIQPLEGRMVQYGYPISDMAAEAGGIACANFVSLGILVGLTGLVKPEAIEEAIYKRYSGNKKASKMNSDAFAIGLAHVKQ